MNEIKVRKRGKKPTKGNKTSNKTITIYQEHYNVIDNKLIELSVYVRWLIQNKLDNYINEGQGPIQKDSGVMVTTIALYQNDLNLIEQIDNFSNFVRWGLEKDDFVNEYLQND